MESRGSLFEIIQKYINSERMTRIMSDLGIRRSLPGYAILLELLMDECALMCGEWRRIESQSGDVRSLSYIIKQSVYALECAEKSGKLSNLKKYACSESEVSSKDVTLPLFISVLSGYIVRESTGRFKAI